LVVGWFFVPSKTGLIFRFVGSSRQKTVIILLGDLFCGVGKDLPSKEDIWEIAGYSSKS